MMGSDLGVFRSETRVAVINGLTDGNLFLADRLGRFETLSCVHWNFSSHLVFLFSLGQVSESLNLSFVVFNLGFNLGVLSLNLGLLPQETVMGSTSYGLGSRCGHSLGLGIPLWLESFLSLLTSARSSHLNLLVVWIDIGTYGLGVGLLHLDLGLSLLHLSPEHLISPSLGNTEFDQDEGQNACSDDHSPFEHLVVVSSVVFPLLDLFFSQLRVDIFFCVINLVPSEGGIR